MVDDRLCYDGLNFLEILGPMNTSRAVVDAAEKKATTITVGRVHS